MHLLNVILHVAIRRRGQLYYLVVKFLIRPVLCDIIQMAVKVHQ